MKNKLEAELKDLANKISQTNFEDARSLKRSARELYEKLTILSFTEENLQRSSPAEPELERAGQENRNGSHPKAESFTNSQSREVESIQSFDDYLPDGTQYNDAGITEPNTEKIKDIVAHMAPETQKMDHMINHIITREETPKKEEPSQRQEIPQAKEPTQEQDKSARQETTLKQEPQQQNAPAQQEPTQKQDSTQSSQPAREKEANSKQESTQFSQPAGEQEAPAKQEPTQKQEPSREQEPPAKKEKDFRDIGVDYDNLPDFEPVQKQEKEQRPRSLNDRLKNGLNIGLNERLAFIKHLFEGKTSDYNRVISQLNTFDSVNDAKTFIQQVVKPDYKNWAGKEEYEERFMYLVENKFSK